MVSRSLSALVAMIPAIALANAHADEIPGIQQGGIETWSVAELCAARASQDARVELERRDVFDGRELRAIRKERVKSGISENVLLCLLGRPDTVVLNPAGQDGTADAFVYSASGASGSLVVLIDREGDDAKVVSVAESYGLSTQVAPGSRFCRSNSRVGGRSTEAVHCDHALALSIITAMGSPSTPPQLPQ